MAPKGQLHAIIRIFFLCGIVVLLAESGSAQAGHKLVRGRVLMSDGSPAPKGVAIERICVDKRVHEDWTDSRGQFAVWVGERASLPEGSSLVQMPLLGHGMASATQPEMEAGSAWPEMMQASCELAAVLPGYHSSRVPLDRLLMGGDLETAVVIYLVAPEQAQGTLVSATSFAAPKQARRAYEDGLKDERRGKLDEAEEHFEAAVGNYPRYAAAWYSLGASRERLQELPKAEQAYQQAVAADPKLVTPYLGLARLAAHQRDWSAVAGWTDQALRLDPVSYVSAHYLNAVAHFNVGELEVAEQSARRGIQLDVVHKFSRLHLLLGRLLLRKKDYPAARESLQRYLQYTPGAEDTQQVRNEIVQAESALGQ